MANGWKSPMPRPSWPYYQDSVKQGFCKICYAQSSLVTPLPDKLTSSMTLSYQGHQCPSRKERDMEPSTPQSTSPPISSYPTSPAPYAPIYTPFARGSSQTQFHGTHPEWNLLPPRIHQTLSSQESSERGNRNPQTPCHIFYG